MYEEALITGFWFESRYQDEVGIGSYSRIWNTNVLVATHLTAYHVMVSMCSSILLVEWLFPSYRGRPWAGRRGLAFAAVALLVVVPLGYGDSLPGPAGQSVAAAILVLLGLAALTRRRGPAAPRPRRLRPRFVGSVAFAGTGAQFLLTYAVPSSGLPWPVGTVIALAPIAVAVLLIGPMTATGDAYGPVGRRIVIGVLSFFVLLDAVVGLGGRYDLTVGAVVTGLVLRRLSRRDRLRAGRGLSGRPAGLPGRAAG